jgi:H/ACA ribonucleoprotein complex subunit 4
MCFLFLLDKPKGITSRQACEIVKKRLNAKKAGHSGTLDANATGLLLIAIDESVKAMPLFERMDKVYEGVMHLHKDVGLEDVEREVKKFVGKIIQKPPVRSRVKRVERERFVYYFNILEKTNRDVKFVTKVEAGTYIRKLVDDIGKGIGGAHLKDLRRIGIGRFEIKDAKKIDEVDKKYLIRLEDALSNAKKVHLKPEFVQKVLNGSPIRNTWILKKEGEMNLGDKIGIFANNRIIGVGVVKSVNFLQIKTDRIIKCQNF